jgi:hypothetical protein
VGLSDDGRFAIFESDADNLSGQDDNGFTNVFVHAIRTGRTRAVSLTSSWVCSRAHQGVFLAGHSLPIFGEHCPRPPQPRLLRWSRSRRRFGLGWNVDDARSRDGGT